MATHGGKRHILYGRRIFSGMNITELKRGDCAVVLKVELPNEMCKRLFSLRVYTGAKIEVLKVSLFKKTYLLRAGTSKIALGREIAKGVRVWRT